MRRPALQIRHRDTSVFRLPFSVPISVPFLIMLIGAASAISSAFQASTGAAQTGRELSVPIHLRDGLEFSVATTELLNHGEHLFRANWTQEEGAGRPLTKGTGRPLADP